MESKEKKSRPTDDTLLKHKKGRPQHLENHPQSFCPEMEPTAEDYCRHLCQSLSALRTASSADVILVCNNQEFYAHRLVLEASSSYFTALFHSGMREALDQRIHFHEMDSETLDAVLDFIYKGELSFVPHVGKLISILEASHLLELKTLFGYCCHKLTKMIDLENWIELWQVGKKLDHFHLVQAAISFVLGNLPLVQKSESLHVLDVDCILQLLRFTDCQHKNMCYDNLLSVVLAWLLYATDGDKHAKVLLDELDHKRISKPFIKAELETTAESNVLENMPLLTAQLKDLAIKVLSSEKSGIIENDSRRDTQPWTSTSLVFFTELRTCRGVVLHQVQVLNLSNMQWQPPKVLPFELLPSFSVCLLGRLFYIVGGTSPDPVLSVIRYDYKVNVGVHLCCSEPPVKWNCVVYGHNEQVYVIGGHQNSSRPSRTVHCYNPVLNKWSKKGPLHAHYFSPTILLGTERVFVGTCCECKFKLEYNSLTISEPWTTLSAVANLPRSLLHSFVLVQGEHVIAFHSHRYLIANKNGDAEWQAISVSPATIGEIQVLASCGGDNPFLIVISDEERNVAPTGVWLANENRWEVLPAAKEQCIVNPSEFTVVCAEGLF